MTTKYDIGDKPVVTATFTDVTGALADPSTVTFMVRDPNGSETTYTSPDATIAKTSLGVWTFTFPSPFNKAGKWYVRAKGSSPVVTAAEVTLEVRSSNFVSP